MSTTPWVTLQIYLLYLSPSLSVTSSVPLYKHSPLWSYTCDPALAFPFIPLFSDSTITKSSLKQHLLGRYSGNSYVNLCELNTFR